MKRFISGKSPNKTTPKKTYNLASSTSDQPQMVIKQRLNKSPNEISIIKLDEVNFYLLNFVLFYYYSLGLVFTI